MDTSERFIQEEELKRLQEVVDRFSFEIYECSLSGKWDNEKWKIVLLDTKGITITDRVNFKPVKTPLGDEFMYGYNAQKYVNGVLVFGNE